MTKTSDTDLTCKWINLEPNLKSNSIHGVSPMRCKGSLASPTSTSQKGASNRDFTLRILCSICCVLFYSLSRLIGGFSNEPKTNL